jgi:hypothetical protein
MQDRTGSIRDIKPVIGTKKSIPFDEQELTIADEEVVDDEFVRNCEIQIGKSLAGIQKSGSNMR